MKSDKELFKLARDYIMLFDLYEKARVDDEEFKEGMNKIRNAVLEKGYDTNKFVEYQTIYKEMTIGEYFEFIKTLD